MGRLGFDAESFPADPGGPADSSGLCIRGKRLFTNGKTAPLPMVFYLPEKVKYDIIH
ncbi:hypothetical protein HMPREF1141_2192 [Clostridium sp. MSTE9]|nr:hypothetical protein HMPREF1141_2192 [Clostridium sp. MSTE9]